MDKLYNGKPYFLMDDLGGKPTILRNTPNPQVGPWIFMFLTLPMQDPRTAGSWGSWREKNMEDLCGYITTKKKMASPTRNETRDPERNEVEFFKDKGKQEKVN